MDTRGHPWVVATVAATTLLLAACGQTATPAASIPPSSTTGPSASGASAAASPAPASDVSSIDTSRRMTGAAAARIDAAARAALADNPDETPGLWIAVWDPKAGYYEAAYGDAIAGTTAATTADHSWIGSITKTVFATAILQQVAAGTLALEDTVAQADPDLAAAYPTIADITVADLLGMVSGVADYADAVVARMAEDHTLSFTRDDLIDIGLAAAPQQPAGTLGYSTTNYIILGNMLTAVTGRTPEDLVNDVFAQAGMTQSMLPAGATTLPEPASHGYIGRIGAAQFTELGAEVQSSTDVSDWVFDWGKEGGGAYSTIGDLATWGGTCLGQSLLPKPIAKARLATHTNETLGEYGLGMQVFGDGWIGHGGQTIGWNSDVECNVTTGAVIALMSNSTDGLIVASGELKSAAFPAR